MSRFTGRWPSIPKFPTGASNPPGHGQGGSKLTQFLSKGQGGEAARIQKEYTKQALGTFSGGIMDLAQAAETGIASLPTVPVGEATSSESMEDIIGPPPPPFDMEWEIVKANNNTQNAEDSVLYNRAPPSPTIFEIMQNKGFNSLDEVINKNKTAIKNRNKGNVLQEGQFVSARPNLDIKRSTGGLQDGVTLLSVHDASKPGKPLGNVLKNTAAITLEDAEFILMHTPQMRVASGEPKSVFSGVKGFLKNDHETDEGVNRNGIVAKFNPFIQHFYMTEDGRAVKSAEEVTVENNKVFLRGRITYYNEDEIKKIEDTRRKRAKKVTDKDLRSFVQSKVNPTRFAHGGFVDKPLYDSPRMVSY